MDNELHELVTRVRRCERMLSALLAHHGIVLDNPNEPPQSVAPESPTKERRWWRKTKPRVEANGEVVS